MLSWAQSHEYVSVNVAGEGINGALPTQQTATNHRALPYGEVAEALEVIEGSSAGWAAKACLRFTILTAARNGEARNAIWKEIDLAARTWTVPAAKMKAGVEHRIPLSDKALDVLRHAKSMGHDSSLVFPSPIGGRVLSDMSLTAILRRNGLATRTTTHGFRSAFRTWAEEWAEADHAVKELSLAHQVGNKVEQAYSRSNLIRKRAVLMQQWAGFITEQSADVVVLHAAS